MLSTSLKSNESVPIAGSVFSQVLPFTKKKRTPHWKSNRRLHCQQQLNALFFLLINVSFSRSYIEFGARSEQTWHYMYWFSVDISNVYLLFTQSQLKFANVSVAIEIIFSNLKYFCRFLGVWYKQLILEAFQENHILRWIPAATSYIMLSEDSAFVKPLTQILNALWKRFPRNFANSIGTGRAA